MCPFERMSLGHLGRVLIGLTLAFPRFQRHPAGNNGVPLVADLVVQRGVGFAHRRIVAVIVWHRVISVGNGLGFQVIDLPIAVLHRRQAVRLVVGAGYLGDFGVGGWSAFTPGGGRRYDIRDGFKHLVRRDPSRLRPLAIDDVSRVHLLGGSILGTSRENPTTSPEATRAVIETLQQAGITHLVTIGGDDTALSSRTSADTRPAPFTASTCRRRSTTTCRCHRTCPRSAFETARHVGVELVRNLMEDARATRRWYIVVAMGRKAGHLALGIGKAAGATLTIVAEEFVATRCRLPTICDIVEGAIIKRRAMGRHFGVAVLAEGLIDKLDPAELAELEDVERDEHGHVRFAEVDLARKVKAEVQGRLSERGLRVTITNKNVGYELRCADPIPFDAEYCRDLGYGAVRFLSAAAAGPWSASRGAPRADSVRRPPGARDRQDEGTPRGHQQRRLPRRPRLHDPTRSRGLRARCLGGPACRRGPSDARRLPPALRVPRSMRP